MNVDDLLANGYVRALWIPSPERWWLRPDGMGACSEEDALAELGGLVGGDGDDQDSAP